jgi:two-component system cell cycle sensor histidine kinase/response regulator CckA
VTKDEKWVIVESRWTLTRDEAGAPQSILVINTDITEKRQLEAQFLRTQRLETIGALAGGIAHDLNNSLTPVLIALACLHSQAASEGDKQLLSLAQTGAQRSVDMVKQILSFSRGVGGAHAKVHIQPLVKEIVQLAEDTFPRSIQVRSKLSPEIYPVNATATQLYQVLLNFCVNARDGMPQGGCLRIEASNIILGPEDLRQPRQAPGPYVLLTVRDNGHGIPGDVLAKIFEPFFTTKEIGKGTGLGLSTVLGIVKTHGGFVEVSSTVGEGTLFRVFLPAIEADRSER